MVYTYRVTKMITDEQLNSLYASVGWSAYTEDLATLKAGLANSLMVKSVWLEGELVGLVRLIGDGETIIYIQDLLVKPSHQRKGIASGLLQQVLEEYVKVRQIVLLTEERPELRCFYEKQGFSSCDQGQVVAYAQFR